MLIHIPGFSSVPQGAVAGGAGQPGHFQSRACPGISVMHVNPVKPGTGVPFYTIR